MLENFRKDWNNYIAVLTAILAVLAAITSLQTSATASSILLEKNNSNYFQSKANKVWNSYLATDITDRVLGLPSDEATQQSLKGEAENLEAEAEVASLKANRFFKRNNDLTTAGTFFEIAIALLAMATLIKKRIIWTASIIVATIGIYFLFLSML